MLRIVFEMASATLSATRGPSVEALVRRSLTNRQGFYPGHVVTMEPVNAVALLSLEPKWLRTDNDDDNDE